MINCVRRRRSTADVVMSAFHTTRLPAILHPDRQSQQSCESAILRICARDDHGHSRSTKEKEGRTDGRRNLSAILDERRKPRTVRLPLGSARAKVWGYLGKDDRYWQISSRAPPMRMLSIIETLAPSIFCKKTFFTLENISRPKISKKICRKQGGAASP